MKLYIATPINARQEPTMREKLVVAKHRVEMLKAILADDDRFKDYELISTFDFNDMYDTEEKAMSRCIYHVLTSDAIYLDHGWTASKGCNLEYQAAKIYGKQIFEHSEYQTKATMKTEEIKPCDILFDEERNMLVKVARVDEDGVVKCSAYTDMGRIFKTVPPPYRVGTRTADVYVPATNEQRKYMERKLAVCEYVNLPKNNRIEPLAYIISDLKAENMELVERVQQLVDEYNDVVRQLDGKETHKDEDPARLLLDNMQKMRDHCDKLEKENRELERFSKAMNEFVIDKNLYMKKDSECPYRPDGIPVCSTDCLECSSCLGDIYDLGVICEKRLKEASVSLPDNE